MEKLLYNIGITGPFSVVCQNGINIIMSSKLNYDDMTSIPSFQNVVFLKGLSAFN